MSDSNRFIALFAEKHHIGDMERCLFFEDPPLSLFAMGTGMPLDEINLLHDHFLFLRDDSQDAAALPLLPAVNDHDQIIFLDMKFRNDHLECLLS